MTDETGGAIRVVEDDLSGPEIAELLGEHLASMHEHSPPGSVHALDLDALRDPAVTFFSAWVLTPEGPDLAGCGALCELDPAHGEVKSMRTAASYLRRGVAAAVLARLLEVARERGYERVSLETGTGPAFEAAHALYVAHGFVPGGPFGGYPGAGPPDLAGDPDPFSRFLTLPLR